MLEVKICDNCNHHNPVTAVECENCGYDLTFTFPKSIEENSNDNKNINNASSEIQNELSSKEDGEIIDWELIYESNNDIRDTLVGESSLGRDGDLFSEQFNSSNYTSRIHAKVRIQNNTVQVMDASTNGTFINDERIPKMVWVTVADGNTIRFADISFVLRKKRNCANR